VEDINKNISNNLKLIRKGKGLTLEDLAGISGVSKSMLGEIERGGTNPTILVLWKIAEGLKIPLTKLIEDEIEEPLIVRKDQLKLISNDAGFSIYSLFPFYDLHNLEIHKIEIDPFSKLSNPGHMDGVDEYIILLEGNIKMVLGGGDIDLYQGDSVRFKGNTAHEFINKCERTALFINVMVYS
jgi:transcriptional regulator with XRE-family HTH domain